MVEKIKITPTEIVTKNSTGVVTYAAGVDSLTGLPHPTYIRTMTPYETYDKYPSNTQIYYNQIAPGPYPVDNVNMPVTNVTACAGHIYKIIQTQNTTGIKINEILSDHGVYCLVPSLLYTVSGNPSLYQNLTVSSKSVVTNVYTFNNISINVVRIQFTDGSVGYFGPCNTSGSLVYVAQDSEFYSYANYSNSKISVNDYYTAQTAFSGNSNLSNSVLLTQNLTPFSSGTPGIIKIVYYSRGSQKLRFTK